MYGDLYVTKDWVRLEAFTGILRNTRIQLLGLYLYIFYVMMLSTGHFCSTLVDHEGGFYPPEVKYKVLQRRGLVKIKDVNP